MSNGNGNGPLYEAPASATARVKSPRGFTYLLTRRSHTMGQLLADLKQLEELLQQNGWEPAEKDHSPGDSGKQTKYRYVDDGVCPEHGPMKEGKYGLFCPRKVGPDEFCNYRIRKG